MRSEVHPLDANSAPYNFSSASSPLLHSAARALNLPTRSMQSYVPVASSSSSETPGVLDQKYTGHILVSGYHVSYVLPKEFPRRESDSRGKRPSSFAQFMAAIDIWAPFLSQPPLAPYLVRTTFYIVVDVLTDCSAAIHTCPALPLQPFAPENLPFETTTEHVNVFSFSILRRRRLRFLGSHCGSPRHPQFVFPPFSVAIIPEFRGRRVERRVHFGWIR